MKNFPQVCTIRNAVLAGLTAACVVMVFPGDVHAAPSDRGFGGVRIGPVSIGYSSFGRGGYGYRNSIGYGHSRYRSNSFSLYGNGPYGYGNGYRSTGNGGWSPNYNTYTPYTTNYYNPYSSWSYSPFGIGVQRSYSW